MRSGVVGSVGTKHRAPELPANHGGARPHTGDLQPFHFFSSLPLYFAIAFIIQPGFSKSLVEDYSNSNLNKG